jgi:hypothetical protein
MFVSPSRLTLAHMGLPGIYCSASHPPEIGLPRRHALSTTNGDPYATVTVTVRRRPAGCPSGRTPSLSCRVPQPLLVCSLPPPPLLSRSCGEPSRDPSGRGLFLLFLAGKLSLLLRMDGFARSLRTRTFDLLFS